MKAPIDYYSNWIKNPDEIFAQLKNELDWERRDDAPRSEYYCNDFPLPYVYGKGRGERLYEPRPYHPAILLIRKYLEDLLHFTFEVCFLNRYLTLKDQLGWHSDDSPEMDDERTYCHCFLWGRKRNYVQGNKIWFGGKIKVGSWKFMCDESGNAK